MLSRVQFKAPCVTGTMFSALSTAILKVSFQGNSSPGDLLGQKV